MKHIFKAILSLTLCLCMLLGTVPFVGALWDFSNGVPADWEMQDSLDAVSAKDVLNTVNPNSSREAKNLLAYLQMVSSSQQFITGQFDISTNNGSYQEVIDDYGVEPVLYSARYIVDLSTPTWATDASGKETTTITNTSMDFTNVDEVNALFKAHYDNGNILLVHSDSAPRELCAAAAMKNKPDQYSDATDAIKELDATNPDRDMQAYALWIKYQNNVIDSLKKLEESGVNAYLWRPWVEYANHAFAGRTDAGYQAFARVYQQTVQMLIDGGLKGFLVAFSPACWTNIISSHPGTEYIDTYAYTIYTERLGVMQSVDLDNDNYQLALRSGKPLGFAEFSCRTGSWTNVTKHARASSFDLLKSTLNCWPEITWVNFWDGRGYDTGNVGGGKDGNDDGKLYWTSDYAITLDEAIDYRTGEIANPGIAQVFETANASDEYVGLAEGSYTAADLKAMGIVASDLRAIRINSGFDMTFWTKEDCTGDYYRFGFSKKNISAELAANFKSLTIGRLANVALDQTEIYASVNDTFAWRANDGFASAWQGDVFDATNDAEAGTAWLYVDLGKAYQVGRYVLKNASYGSLMAMYNTADFQIQYSDDCENWSTVDTVTGNTMSQVDRNIEAVTAQYFRVLITDPNSCLSESDRGTVTIAEFELYGVDPGLLASWQEPEKPPVSGDSTTKPTIKPTTKPTTKPTAKPTTKPTIKPTTTKKPTTTMKKPTTTTTKKPTTTTKPTTAVKLSTPKVSASNATKGIKVTWNKVKGATSYRVYRRLYSSGKWGSWSRIKSTSSTSYTDTKAKAGKNYQYMVKAVKGSVTSGYKATATITRLGVAKVTAANATKGIKVSWGKVTGATSYRVYRRLYSSGKWGSWSRIKSTKSTSYTDTKAKTGKNYQYMVRAVKGDSTGYYKATATIRRLKAPGSVKLKKATKGFKVTWSKATGATKYEVYRRTGSGSYSKIATTSKTGYTDKTAKKGKYYTYRVRAVYSKSKSVFKTGSKVKR